MSKRPCLLRSEKSFFTLPFYVHLLSSTLEDGGRNVRNIGSRGQEFDRKHIELQSGESVEFNKSKV